MTDKACDHLVGLLEINIKAILKHILNIEFQSTRLSLFFRTLFLALRIPACTAKFSPILTYSLRQFREPCGILVRTVAKALYPSQIGDKIVRYSSISVTN